MHKLCNEYIEIIHASLPAMGFFLLEELTDKYNFDLLHILD